MQHAEPDDHIARGHAEAVHPERHKRNEHAGKQKTMQPRRKLREPSVAQQPDRTTKITPPYCCTNTYHAGSVQIKADK